MSRLQKILGGAAAVLGAVLGAVAEAQKTSGSKDAGSATPRLTPKPRKSTAAKKSVPTQSSKKKSSSSASAQKKSSSSRSSTAATQAGAEAESAQGQSGSTATRAVDPERMPNVRVSYAPSMDGEPDAGEVIWTWVPYAENDGRGKDRPVLVIGRQSETRAFAVRMTSKDRDGDRDYIAIGPGAWDSQGRPSWVDIEQLYSVHTAGMRREAAALDRARYAVVAKALIARYGWAAGDAH